MKKMAVLITGGAGFIGSHLCEKLLDEGFKVICLDNLITGRVLNIKHLLCNKKFIFIKQDVSVAITIKANIAYVLHFASCASPDDYLKYPIQTLGAGAFGTRNALELAYAKKAKFLLASTSEVYGDPLLHPQPESYWGNVNPVGVRGCYDEAKRFAEALTMAYLRVHKVDTRIVRIFNTYGPRMRIKDGRVVPNFIGQALHNKPLTLYGSGSQTRSFCYVDDLVLGIYKLMHSEMHYPLNLGNPNEFTILQLAKLVKKLSGTKARLAFRQLPQDDPKQRKPDISKAKKLLNWQPKIELEEGLTRTIAWFKSHL